MRPTVFVAGSHPALNLVRQWLIRHGALLTSHIEEATHRIIGGYSQQLVVHANIPTLVLSTSDVYWSPDEKPCFSEDDILAIPSTRDISVLPAIECITSEALAFRHSSKTLVLRTFNVYGPSVYGGFVSAFVAQAKLQEALSIPLPGYQERTFLFEEDFLAFFGYFWEKFSAGLSGIYNVGSPVSLSLNRAADVVWQRTNHTKEPAPVTQESLPFSLQWKVVPDMTRTHAEIPYKAATTLSAGIWKMNQ